MADDKFAVEASHIMMFARSVGDANRIYYDEDSKDTEPGGIIAPPTFVQASAQFDPDYRLRPKIGEPWFGSGREATGVKEPPGAGGGGGGLHHKLAFGEGSQLYPADAITVRISQCSCYFDGEPRLATATRAREGEDPGIGEQVLDVGRFLLAADEVGQVSRQVVHHHTSCRIVISSPVVTESIS